MKTSKTQEEAQEIVADILNRATEHISNEDSAGMIKQPVEYLQCFNQLCCDIAWEVHQMSDAEYNFIINQYDLIQNPAIKEHYN